PLPVARIAVGEVRRLPEHAHLSRFLVPPHDPVVGDVAPEDIPPVAEPHRTLRPAEPGRELLHLAGPEPVGREALIHDLDGRVWIPLARLELRQRLARRHDVGLLSAGCPRRSLPWL